MGICSSKKDYAQAKANNLNNNGNDPTPGKDASPSPQPKPPSNSAHKNQPDKNPNLFKLLNKKLESNPEQKKNPANCPTYQKLQPSETSEQEESLGMVVIQENLIQSKLPGIREQQKKQVVSCQKTVSKQMKQNSLDEKDQLKQNQQFRKDRGGQSNKAMASMLTIKRGLQSTQDLARNPITLLN